MNRYYSMHLMSIQSKKLSDIISSETMSPQRSSGLGTSSFRLPSLIQKNVSPSSLQNMGVASVSEAYFVFAIGLLLALNSGYINGLFLSGLLAEEGSDKVNVSAVTRAYTESGLNLVSGLYSELDSHSRSYFRLLLGHVYLAFLTPRRLLTSSYRRMDPPF